MHCRNIVIGVTGGIAAYKIPHLIRLLQKRGAAVKVVVTAHAQPLVGIEALHTLSGNPVYTDTATNYDMDHIRLTEWADFFLIAPGTANTIAKIAHGIGDNLLTTLALAFPPEKIMIAPAMNTAMWENKLTQENVRILKDTGISVLPVGTGELACGVSGAGRMIAIEAISGAVMTHMRNEQPLGGVKVLISSGPTEEPIDPVRVITNRSSGKMGAALAAEAFRLGAEVTVVSGPAVTPLPDNVTVIPVRTASEMEREMNNLFPDAAICIMAAAVSDYRPVTASEQKMHRYEKKHLTIELSPNNDILAGLGKRKKQGQLLVGFALEDDAEIDRAVVKLKRKKCDVLILNSVKAALGNDQTEVHYISSEGKFGGAGPASKTAVAHAILTMLGSKLRGGK